MSDMLDSIMKHMQVNSSDELYNNVSSATANTGTFLPLIGSDDNSELKLIFCYIIISSTYKANNYDTEPHVR